MFPVGKEICTAFTSTHAVQLLRLLRLLAGTGVVHRDLRPTNLLFYNGRLLVIDWAFAVDTTTMSAEQVLCCQLAVVAAAVVPDVVRLHCNLRGTTAFVIYLKGGYAHPSLSIISMIIPYRLRIGAGNRSAITKSSPRY
jgi:hypothetical protein